MAARCKSATALGNARIRSDQRHGTLSRSDTYTFGGAISQGGSVINSGRNARAHRQKYLQRRNHDHAGTLQIGSGGASGSPGSGAVTDNATLSFSRSDVYTVPVAISGAGGLTQLGPGTLVLNAGDNYTGRPRSAAAPCRPPRASVCKAASISPSTAACWKATALVHAHINTGSRRYMWSSLGGGFAANGGTLTVNLDGNHGYTVTWGTATGQIQRHAHVRGRDGQCPDRFRQPHQPQ